MNFDAKEIFSTQVLKDSDGFDRNMSVLDAIQKKPYSAFLIQKTEGGFIVNCGEIIKDVPLPVTPKPVEKPKEDKKKKKNWK